MYDFEASSSQAFEIGDTTLLDGLTEFSCHAVCSCESNGSNRTILGKDGGSPSQFRFYRTDAGVNLVPHIPKVIIFVGGVTVRAEGATAEGFPLATLLRYGMRFKVNDADGLGVFINGARQDTSPNPTTTILSGLPNNAFPLYLGQRVTTTLDPWDGFIGEVAIWDVFLHTLEFESMNYLSALAVRPESLIFYWDGRSPKAWLPKAGTFVDLTPINAPALLENTYDPEEACWDEEDMAGLGAGVATYGPWTELTDRPPTASYRDVNVVNGTSYQYRVRARDFAGNESADSAGTGDLTPVAGVPVPGGILLEDRAVSKVMKSRRYRSNGYRWRR